jgi:hypothetical protein
MCRCSTRRGGKEPFVLPIELDFSTKSRRYIVQSNAHPAGYWLERAYLQLRPPSESQRQYSMHKGKSGGFRDRHKRSPGPRAPVVLITCRSFGVYLSLQPGCLRSPKGGRLAPRM